MKESIVRTIRIPKEMDIVIRERRINLNKVCNILLEHLFVGRVDIGKLPKKKKNLLRKEKALLGLK